MESTTLGHAEERPFSLYAHVTYASLYMEDGFRVGGDHPVWQPSLEITSPFPGLSLALCSSLQLDRQNQQYDELDIMALYKHDFARESSIAFNLHGYVGYWSYPKLNGLWVKDDDTVESQGAHGNKLHVGISMIKLIPLVGSHLVPTYNVYYRLGWDQNRSNPIADGTHHELILSYLHDIPKFVLGASEPYVGISGSVNYHGGAFGVPPGLSHTTAQLSAGIHAPSWSGSLSINRQWSYLASVDPNNELWTMLSLNKRF